MTNVRFSHDDKKLVSLGGADMSVMVWSHSAGSRDPTPPDDQSDAAISSGYMSQESDTDSEEEGEICISVTSSYIIQSHESTTNQITFQ